MPIEASLLTNDYAYLTDDAGDYVTVSGTFTASRVNPNDPLLTRAYPSPIGPGNPTSSYK